MVRVPTTHRRLVEHEQLRARDERERKPHALRLAAGQLLRPLRGKMRRARQREHVVDRQRPRVERREHRHELADGEVARQPARLQHRSDRSVRNRLGGRAPEDGDAAAIGRKQPEQHLERRRLAGPVRPEQRHRFAAFDRDLQVAHRLGPPAAGLERLTEPVQIDPAPHARRRLFSVETG
jgi:hypothetical protein